MWTRAKLKYVARLVYGDSLHYGGSQDGTFLVFGSNGPFASSSRSNTQAPAIIIGRKGSYGKVNWTAEPCFASDTTFFIDESTSRNHLRWIYWLLQTLQLSEETDEAAVPGLNRETVYSKDVLVPPLSKQRAIANYLDRQTARLDALVATKVKVLSLLAEKRRALITRAVTRGLEAQAPLRDSGIPWIGEIPRHWEVWKLGHSASIGNGATPSRGNADYWTNGSIPWLTSSVVNQNEVTSTNQFVTDLAFRECHLPLVRAGSVLVAITGQGKTRGQAIVLSIDATINQHLAYITPDHLRLDPWFLRWTLFSAYGFLRSISDNTGGTKGALTCDAVANLRVQIPPVDEQRAIVSHIANEASKLEELRISTEKTTALLRERRSALVSAAITGEIDVESSA